MAQTYQDGGYSVNLPIFPKEKVATLSITPFAGATALISPQRESYLSIGFGAMKVEVLSSFIVP